MRKNTVTAVAWATGLWLSSHNAFADTQNIIDEKVQTIVMTALSSEPAFQAQGISTEVRWGTIHLKGEVSSLEDKRRASEIARSAAEGYHIQNEISVKKAWTGGYV